MAAAIPGLRRCVKRAVLYVLPLGLYAMLCWEGCGADIWALSRMVPVQGVLDNVETTGKPPTTTRSISNTVLVSYRYVVGGQQYHGENMICCRALTNGTMLDPMLRMRDRLLPSLGRQVTVWVDPRDPWRAVLFRHVPKSALLLMGAGLLFGFCGLRWFDRLEHD